MRRHTDDNARDLAELRAIARRLRASEEADDLRVIRLVDALEAFDGDDEVYEVEAFDPERPVEQGGPELAVYDVNDPYPF